MSTKPLMLEGVVRLPKHDDDALEDLRRDNNRLESELRTTRAVLEDAKAENLKLSRSVKALRHILGPLHTSLRALFGEIELAIGEEEFTSSSPGAAPQTQSGDPRWESYKSTLPGLPARIIDALMAHREMTMTQLSKLLRAHYDSIQKCVRKLIEVGAVKREGTMCRLNQ